MLTLSPIRSLVRRAAASRGGESRVSAWLWSLLIVLPLVGWLPFDGLRSSRLAADESTPKSKATGSNPAATAEPVHVKTAKTGKGEPPAFTREREAAALEFVRLHHPELAELLDRLKSNHRSEYERAVRELFRTSERFAQLQERNPGRYQSDLQLWKLNSRIQVLIARLAMETDPQVERELRAVLAEQIELKRQQLQSERDKAAAKLAELDRELERDGKATVEERLQQLVQGTKDRRKQRDAKSDGAKTEGNKSNGKKSD